jgi:hypothetical protein
MIIELNENRKGEIVDQAAFGPPQRIRVETMKSYLAGEAVSFPSGGNAFP